MREKLSVLKQEECAFGADEPFCEGILEWDEKRMIELILKRDKYHPIYLDTFNILSYGKTRRVLDRLTDKNILKKIKAFPVFYERLR